MTDRPGRSGFGPSGAGRDSESVGERVQARFDDWSERGDVLPPRPQAAIPLDPEPVGGEAVAAEVEALQSQLDVLRRQLEDAFADVDDRIAAAGNVGAAAAKVAEEAGERAQVALDRTARVIAAAEALGAELHRLTSSLPDEVAGDVEAAIERFRSRLQSA